jgi:DNA polymerase-3 subunit gamma/tau
MLSNSAFNALLKTLEEPPPHARFVLATTEPHKIPATISSRCQRFDFRRLSVPEIAGHLRHIVAEEGFTAEDDALTAIGRSAQGCMRDAISLLDQMLSYGNETLTFAQVQQVLGAVSAQVVQAMVEALAKKDVASGLKLVQQLMLEGASLSEFCHQVIEHLRGVLVVQMTGNSDLLSDLPGEIVEQMQAQARTLSQPATIFAIKRFSAAVSELKGSFQPQLPLELALIEAIQGEVTPIVATNAPPQSLVAPLPAATAQPETPAAQPGASTSPSANQVNAQPTRQMEPQPLDAAAVQRLRSQWKEFTNAVRQQCGIQVQAAMHPSSVRDVAIGAHTIAFAFGENHFARDKVTRPEILSKVTAILSNILGRSVLLECQMGDKARLSDMVVVPTQSDNPAGPDPLVEYAVSTLQAKVLE